MAIPAAHALHAAGCLVDWVCGRTVAPLLRLYSWINVIEIDDSAILHGKPAERLFAIASLWKRLFREEYDVCATLYYDKRYRLLTAPVRAERKIMLSRLDRATMLLPGRHHTDEYARILLAQISQEYANGETPSQLAPVPAKGLPANPITRTSSKARIVLVPAGARNALRDDPLRRWPVDRYVETAALLLARGYEVVLVGGPGDEWAASKFEGLKVIDKIGQFTLLETLALLDSADVAVVHDTGPLHLAGITSCAIVTIFGPTDPRGRLPQRPNSIALWGGEGFACRPCYDGHSFAPCENNGCMQQITASMVLEEVERLLTALNKGCELPPLVRVPPHTPMISSIAPALL
jgi:heptosyltransferase-2